MEVGKHYRNILPVGVDKIYGICPSSSIFKCTEYTPDWGFRLECPHFYVIWAESGHKKYSIDPCFYLENFEPISEAEELAYTFGVL